MIRYLNIQRLAVIDQLEIEFGPGLSVLTGETGAGKSILVEAVGLLLGSRASADLVRTGAETASVQAVIDGADGSELIVRREVSAQGRSRAFVDGALVTTAALRDAVADLVDLHGQHEHQSLLNASTQLALLDRFADLEEARSTWLLCTPYLVEARDALADAERTDRNRVARLDLLEFQKHEIDKVAAASQARTSLSMSSAASPPTPIASAVSARKATLPCMMTTRRCCRGWATCGSASPISRSSIRGSPPSSKRARAVRSQLEELAFCLRDFAAAIEGAGDRLQALEDRLAQLDRLKQRYGPPWTRC